MRSRFFSQCLLPQRFARPTCLSSISRFVRHNHGDAISTGVTPLEQLVRSSIKATGPVSYSYYMQLCLSHPELGYYMSPTNPIIGEGGDFVTSPEISQIFGELIAVWFTQQWIMAGCPPAVRLIELGPGKGTLTLDIGRTCNRLWKNSINGQPRYPPRIERQVFMVENSRALRQIQSDTISQIREGGWDPLWLDSVQDVEPSSAFTMVVAHEFFDALPVDVFKKTEEGWNEVKIGMPVSNEENLLPPLQTILEPTNSPKATTLAALYPKLDEVPVGQTVEVSQASWSTSQKIAELLGEGGGGSALIIDYGQDGPSHDSFRAFHKHKQVSPFHLPGQTDLTANVNFDFLTQAFKSTSVPHLEVYPTLPQGSWLEHMGIYQRSGNAKESVRRAVQRLVDPNGMGNQYRFLGVNVPLKNENAGQAYPFTF
ncbi:S-adenosyl-L-methionine-dependent methyltransferase [Flagelloscypha sp. PMI_526]|nr:S-adenosyl-L-methionine-dependent methyltransferase [Flagelloscypha sp. PMI_526]